MTPEEVEESKRNFEIAGTLVCTGLGILFFQIPFLFETHYAFGIVPLSLVVMLVTAFSYGFVFYGLDRWRRGFFQKYKSDIRVNGLVIPFLSAFFSFANNDLLFSWFGEGVGKDEWLKAALLFTTFWGIFNWFVMLLFWGIGCMTRRSYEQVNISITQP